MNFFHDAVTVLRRSVTGAKQDGITTTAQALAYSLFLAIPALFLVILGAFSLVASPADVTGLVNRMSGVIPSEAATLLNESLVRSTESPRSGVVMTVVGLALALWATLSAATTLMKGITTADSRDDQRGFVRKRIVAFTIVACLVLAIGLVTALLVLGPYLERSVGAQLGQPGLTAWVWWTAQWPILIVGLLVAFSVLLYLGPDVEQPGWKGVLPGATVALLAWLATSVGFAFYASRFGSYNKSWGTLSAVVVLLIWLWLTSAALLFGAEVNAQTRKLVAEAEASVEAGAAAAIAATQWGLTRPAAAETAPPTETSPPTVVGQLRSISKRASRALHGSAPTLSQGQHAQRLLRSTQRRKP